MEEETTGTTIEQLNSILHSTEKLLFKGRDSLLRLKCLNRVAHLAVNATLDGITGQEGNSFAQDQVRYMERFNLNKSCLNCLEALTGESCRLGFEKVKQRFMEDLKFFIERENASPIRQKKMPNQ